MKNLDYFVDAKDKLNKELFELHKSLYFLQRQMEEINNQIATKKQELAYINGAIDVLKGLDNGTSL